MSVKISEYDEQRLRALAQGMAQAIRDPKLIMNELGITEEDWKELERSRTFRKMLGEAQSEWNAAGSTSKRIKLKAGVNIEMSLPQFYTDMNNVEQPLGARVRLLEAMTTLAGLPEHVEAERAPGAQFKLEIHLAGVGGVEGRVEVLNIGGEKGAIPQGPVMLEQHESFKLPDYIYFEE